MCEMEKLIDYYIGLFWKWLYYLVLGILLFLELLRIYIFKEICFVWIFLNNYGFKIYSVL